jgi:alpha-beta hydrolase superfamily lysophospholipase
MVRSLARWLFSVAGSVLLGLALIGAVLYWLFLRSGPAPAVWHEIRLDDFTAAQAGSVLTLDDYQALEERLFAELEQRVYGAVPAAERIPFSRYSTGSRSDPGVWPVNWNRTFRLEPVPGTAPRGAVLLLHGLTDSPYSLRSIGEHLVARGFEVVGLRLPGHGTAPSGLLTFRVEDMQAAVRLAVRDLHSHLTPGQPLYLVGYSNGAALSIDYALAALDDATLPRPAGLVLLSPAISISKFAAVGRVKTGLSSLPGFGRAAWEVIGVEFDPYKYTSFSFHGAGETFRLTRKLARAIERRATDRPLQGFPPVLAFLSSVDSTVKAEAVTDVLLEHLAPDGHELVLFDVNRLAAVQALMVTDPGPLTQRLRGLSQRPYTLTVITNASPESPQVVELRSPAGSATTLRRALALEWPRPVFSLSHVALPFPPDDPLYGYAAPPPGKHVQLGDIEVRGENGVLKVPMWALTRQRSNPFHGYLLERIDGFVDAAATH